MKTKINKLNDPKSKSRPLDVHIKVLFEDDDHSYKDLYLITNTEELSRTIKASQKILNQDSSYMEKIYNETINLAFRPKVTFDIISDIILKYISCELTVDGLKKHIRDNPNNVIDIVVHLNVDTNDFSAVSLMPSRPGHEYYGSVFMPSESSKLSLALRSKLLFLNLMERVFLIRLVDTITDLGNQSCRWKYGQLLNFWAEQISEEEKDEVNKDTLSGIIDTLLFYDFITLKQEDVCEEESGIKEHYFIFSICDQEIYNELFPLLYKDRAA